MTRRNNLQTQRQQQTPLFAGICGGFTRKKSGASDWNRTSDLGLMRPRSNSKKTLILQGFRKYVLLF